MEKKIDKRKEVEITLDFPVQLADRMLEKVVLRRPTVADIIAHPLKDANDIKGESELYAALADLVPDELMLLDISDYQKIQKQYLLFRDAS